MGRIVKMKIREGDQPTKAQLKRLADLKHRPIVLDDEAPEYTMEELEEMRLAAIKKRAEHKKEVIAIRVSPSTLQKVKEFGKGYTGFLSRLIDNAINDKELVAKSL